MPSKLLATALMLCTVGAFSATAQNTPDTACARLVHFRYDRFTEEKKVWTNDAVTVDNSPGEADYPLAAKVYRIKFANTLTGKMLESYEAALLISDELLKQPVSEKEVIVHFIFEGDNKFHVKSAIINNGYVSKMVLPLEGNLLSCYKSKNLKALRLSGVRGTSVDFDLTLAQSEQLVREMTCMFGYKQ